VGNYKNTSPLNLLEFFLPLPACGRQGRSTNRTKTEIYFILIIHLRPKGHLLQRRTKSRNKNAPPRLPPKGDKIKNSFYTYINYDKVSPYKSQLVYDASHLIQVGNYKNTSPLNLLEFFLPLPACGRQGRSTNRTKTEIYFILIIHLRPKGHLLQRRTKSRNKNAPPRLPPKLRYRRDPPLSAQGGLPKEGNFNTKYRRLKG